MKTIKEIKEEIKRVKALKKNYQKEEMFSLVHICSGQLLSLKWLLEQ